MKAQNAKQMPSINSDKAAEEFVSNSDLSRYDFSSFKPMHFEIEAKSAALNMRLPSSLLSALKAKAKAKGIPYTRYVRMLLESDLTQSTLKS